MNLEKILYVILAIVFGLFVMAIVSPELFSITELEKLIEHLIKYGLPK